jgi:hypothetical protein
MTREEAADLADMARQLVELVTVHRIAAWLRARMAEGPIGVEEIARALEEGTWTTK